jgi:hypothetical protein
MAFYEVPVGAFYTDITGDEYQKISDQVCRVVSSGSDYGKFYRVDNIEAPVTVTHSTRRCRR